ncbi:MAG: TonB-dependent receptor plug domain-containing protein [Bacteroidales bacterium]|nr:TonB-dependent receptor plug domain-containing protein [Bacteroidales bacterium]
MKKTILTIIVAVMASMPAALAQVVDQHGHAVDTTSIYGERADSLDAAVFVSRQAGNYLAKGKDIRTEVISAAGLCKMACCNLAESFENSASVTVGYSDAVTGARQIRLLGLSGTYTQMLDETRPVMRGLAAPFGLSYVPGQWLESIQIAKGSSSVINGVECMTGQINMEHRKPTDEKPLFLNAAVMSDTKMDFNIASSLQMGYKWSTVLLGHVSGNIKPHDMNQDGFLDEPKMLQFNFANRWLYQADNGTQVRFGVRAIQDRRHGGQMLKGEDGKDVMYDKDEYILDPFQAAGKVNPWGSDIFNRSLNGYLKVGVPLNEENSQNVALIADYNYQDMDSYFGSTKYLAGQHSAYANLLYQNVISDEHQFTLGLNGTYDRYDENFTRITWGMGPVTAQKNGVTDLANVGAYGEYTYHYGETLSVIAGLRGDWFYGQGFKVSPRMTLKYMPVDEIVIRANGGRGLRYSTPLVDNIGVFSTGKEFLGAYNEHILEDAWTFGGNITYYLPFGATSSTYISFDYFRTQFAQQMVVDYGRTQIDFYALDGGTAFTDNYQVDFSVDPVERFNITMTFRYTNAMQQYKGSQAPVEKPMTSRFKGVLNLQYATNLNKWIFDFTASLNGSCRVYDFMEDLKDENGNLLYKNGRTPVYPMLYAQVTRRFKGWDVYVGAENLTNFTQKDVILGTKGEDGLVNPRLASFDASCIWGPLMGFKAHVGFRFTLWK